MSKWFCNGCKSLNANGAKKCYACGAKHDYLGLDGLGGVKPLEPAAAAPSRRDPRGLVVVQDGAAEGEMAFADSRRRARRRSLRGLAAVVISGVVLVALIGAVAVLGIGRGPNAGGPAGSPGHSPAASSADPAPSASAAPGKPSAEPPAKTPNPAPAKPNSGNAPPALRVTGSWTNRTVGAMITITEAA